MQQLNELLIPLFERLERIESLITNKDTSSLMSIKDVARYTSLSQPTIRRSVMRGTLKPIKDEGKKLFRRSDVDRWLKG
jgi:excisionase family DNA binding protein|tara:strand:- start:775 stop:1011 length:237 start_codon:yes stop_codon:yes gene_type:complete